MSTTLFNNRSTPDTDRPPEGDAAYAIKAAPTDAWREYDFDHPDPPYFQFDSLSSRHPDLYDRFALSSDGLMAELRSLVDLSGLTVCDVGAGTGRSARAAARIAAKVIAVDRYDSVVRFGEARLRDAGISNVAYRLGDRTQLPLDDHSVDAVTACFAVLDDAEALRVVRPGGWIIMMYCPMAPNAVAGELTRTLVEAYPALARMIPTVAPDDWFRDDCPPADFVEPLPDEVATRFVGGVRHVHDFTYTAQYESSDELAAIVGRFYGRTASRYIRERGQSTLTWRLRIEYVRRSY